MHVSGTQTHPQVLVFLRQCCAWPGLVSTPAQQQTLHVMKWPLNRHKVHQYQSPTRLTLGSCPSAAKPMSCCLASLEASLGQPQIWDQEVAINLHCFLASDLWLAWTGFQACSAALHSIAFEMAQGLRDKQRRCWFGFLDSALMPGKAQPLDQCMVDLRASTSRA